MVSKEMRASGLAERAWGQILHWHRAGKVQGGLTYEEFRQAMEPLFMEALLEPGPKDWTPRGRIGIDQR